jgi:hypothetical protein
MVSPHEFFAKTFPQEWDAMRRFWRIAWRISRAISIMAVIGISVPAAIGAFLVGKWAGTTNIYNNISAPPPPPDASASSKPITTGTIAEPPKDEGTLTERPDLISMFVRDLQPPTGFIVYGCTEYDRTNVKETTYYKIIGDVTANSKFLSFYIPRSPSSFDTITSIASDYSTWIVNMENTIHFHNSVQGNTTPIHSQDMVFSNIVYVYQEDVLDAVLIGDLTKYFHEKGITLELRSVSYVLGAWDAIKAGRINKVPQYRMAGCRIVPAKREGQTN